MVLSSRKVLVMVVSEFLKKHAPGTMEKSKF